MTQDAYMPNPPAYASDIQYWHGYGFVAPDFVTTNGSLPVLLSALRSQADKDAVTAWASSILEKPNGNLRY